MSDYRFTIGTSVMCNFGQEGWKLGRIIALNYREETWAKDIFAPYQVLLEENHSLIYVPEDDNRFCREAALEDINILKRKDALAAYQSDVDEIEDTTTASPQHGKLSCTTEPGEEKHQRYRKGRCFCCNDCPTDWSYVELYSEHYRCAGRNNLPITRHEINLGTVACGEEICYTPDGALSDMAGFERQNVQHPQLPREVPRADQS